MPVVLRASFGRTLMATFRSGRGLLLHKRVPCRPADIANDGKLSNRSRASTPKSSTSNSSVSKEPFEITVLYSCQEGEVEEELPGEVRGSSSHTSPKESTTSNKSKEARTRLASLPSRVSVEPSASVRSFCEPETEGFCSSMGIEAPGDLRCVEPSSKECELEAPNSLVCVDFSAED